MKNFALKHPFAASVLVFFTVFIGGTIFSIISGLLLMRNNGHCDAPCDGGAMAAVAMWYVGFFGSLILGFLAGVLTFIILLVKIWKKEKEFLE